mmetsp:Transcript_47978/g.127077  ORF Transcript_47978/g.127077 Transcript_47978/m.127077 type:complete len:335 (-) Transcript_47978:1018-2022(-)
MLAVGGHLHAERWALSLVLTPTPPRYCTFSALTGGERRCRLKTQIQNKRKNEAKADVLAFRQVWPKCYGDAIRRTLRLPSTGDGTETKLPVAQRASAAVMVVLETVDTFRTLWLWPVIPSTSSLPRTGLGLLLAGGRRGVIPPEKCIRCCLTEVFSTAKVPTQNTPPFITNSDSCSTDDPADMLKGSLRVSVVRRPPLTEGEPDENRTLPATASSHNFTSSWQSPRATSTGSNFLSAPGFGDNTIKSLRAVSWNCVHIPEMSCIAACISVTTLCIASNLDVRVGLASPWTPEVKASSEGLAEVGEARASICLRNWETSSACRSLSIVRLSAKFT